MSPERRSRPNEGPASRSCDGDKISVANATTTAAYLGVETWQLPVIRGVVRDPRNYDPQLLDYLVRSKPGDTARGGGLMWLWPDGSWHRQQPADGAA
jgi:hypothetical protein